VNHVTNLKPFLTRITRRSTLAVSNQLGGSMESFLSREVLEGLARARNADQRKKNRLRLTAGGESFPVLRLWDNGFSMDASHKQHLRGLVDIFDGGRHLSQCLIIHSERDGSTMRYEFKRKTEHVDAPPVDFEIAEDAPVALLR
jgi:hypothetical protein